MMRTSLIASCLLATQTLAGSADNMSFLENFVQGATGSDMALECVTGDKDRMADSFFDSFKECEKSEDMESAVKDLINSISEMMKEGDQWDKTCSMSDLSKMTANALQYPDKFVEVLKKNKETDPYVQGYLDQARMEFAQGQFDMAGMHLGFALKMGAGFAGFVEKVTLQDDGSFMTPQGSMFNLSIASGITEKTTDAAHSVTEKTTDAAHSITDKTTDAAHSITDAVTEPFLVLEGLPAGFTPKYAVSMVGAFIAELVYLNRLSGLTQCAVGGPETYELMKEAITDMQNGQELAAFTSGIAAMNALKAEISQCKDGAPEDIKALASWFERVAGSKQAMVDTASAQALVHSQEIVLHVESVWDTFFKFDQPVVTG